MEFYKAFPVAIIDEDFEGKNAAGRGMRDLAAAIEKEGYRVVSGINYEDARRLVHVFNTESCWLVSVDGAEDKATRWEILEEVLVAKRRKNDLLPIFLFGDDTTAEEVPASVLRHANAFMRLFEDSPEFMARVLARAAQNYLDRLPPPMFRALMQYTLHGAYSWHTPGHGGGVAFRKSPVGQLFYQFFGENTVRSDISVSVGSLGSLLDHVGPIAEGERNAARIFGADETFFVVGGTSTANKIVWHGTVGRGDLVLCDRNCHKSILHSLIMTGSTPIYLTPSRNGLGIIGPISKDQFTPAAIAQKIAASPFAGGTSGQVRLMVVTNSTYDGLCYNVDGAAAAGRRAPLPRAGAARRRGAARGRPAAAARRRWARCRTRAPARAGSPSPVPTIPDGPAPRPAGGGSPPAAATRHRPRPPPRRRGRPRSAGPRTPARADGAREPAGRG